MPAQPDPSRTLFLERGRQLLGGEFSDWRKCGFGILEGNRDWDRLRRDAPHRAREDSTQRTVPVIACGLDESRLPVRTVDICRQQMRLRGPRDQTVDFKFFRR